MSYLGPSRPVNVQNLTNAELIELIKNDEYFSGCCRIIEEKKLVGFDILTLSENRVKTWRIPEWLSKRLISLKEKLANDPASLLSLSGDGLEHSDVDPKEHISNALTTLFKGKQIPLPPIRKASAEEGSKNASIKKETDPDLIDDNDNYLKPDYIRGPREPKFNKPAFKLPNPRGQEIVNNPSRKPFTLPRQDLDDEENTYEPPPTQKIKPRKPAKLPISVPSPSEEIISEYEVIPSHEDSTEDLQYEYIEMKRRESPENEKERTRSQFFVENDFPPPIPDRKLTEKQQEAKSWPNPPFYMNVNITQSSITNADSSERKNSLNPLKKINLINSRPVSPVIPDAKKIETKKSWSTLTRPLPPLPPQQEAPSSKARKEIEPKEEQGQYKDQKHNKSPEIETLPEYHNTTESSNKTSQPSLISELKSRTSTQHLKDRSNVKLHKSQSIIKASPDESTKELREKLEKRHGNTLNIRSEKDISFRKSQMKLPLPPPSFPTASDDFNHDDSAEQPEYGNTIEIETKTPAWKTQKNNSPLNQLGQTISQLKLKPTTPQLDYGNSTENQWGIQETSIPPDWRSHDETESDFEDDFDEDTQPEYLNTFEPEVEKSSNTQGVNNLSDKFRVQLLRKMGQKDRIADREVPANAYPPINSYDDGKKGYLTMSYIGSEDQPEYGNTVDTKTISTGWRTQQNTPPVVNQFAHEISKIKLKPSTPQKFPERQWELQDNQEASTRERHGETGKNFEGDHDEQEDQPEYGNTADIKTIPTGRRTQPNKSSTVNQFTLEISMKKLRPTTPQKELGNFPEKKWGVQEKQELSNREHRVEKEDDSEEDHEEQGPETRVRKTSSNFQAIASSLASQLAHVQLKPTPVKDIRLDDELADELRNLLQKRKGQNEKSDDGRNFGNSHPQIKPPTTLSQNFNSTIADIENDDDNEQENYDVAGSYNDLLNFNNEPFYRNTDRKGAILLLKDLEDGAFLLRPSRKFFLSITIKYKAKYFNLGIEKTSTNKIFCGEEMMRTMEFFSLKSFLEYYEHAPLILQRENGIEEVYLKKVLPPDRF